MTSQRFKSVAAIAAASVGMLVLAACGGGDTSSSSASASASGAASSAAASESTSGGGSAAAATTINVLDWEGYHSQKMIDECAKETGVTANVVNVGSPAEMFSKLKAAPDQFDVALVTSGWFEQYVAEGLLAPVDEAKLPNIANIKLGFPWKDATSVDGTNYGVLYTWGDQALFWMDGKVPTDGSVAKYLDDKGNPKDWQILWDPAFKGKVSIFDDPTSVMPMIALAAGVKDPYNWSDADYEAVKKKLDELRPQIKRLTSGFDDQTTQFANGEATIGYMNHILTVVALAEQGKKMGVNHTVDLGVPAWSDNYAITKAGEAKADAVYAWMNCTLEPAKVAEFIAETGNSATFNYEQATSEEAKAAGLTEDKLAVTLIPATQQGDAFFKSMLFFKQVEDLQKRIDLWNEFKLGLGN